MVCEDNTTSFISHTDDGRIEVRNYNYSLCVILHLKFMVYPVLLVKVVQGFIVYDIVKPLNIKIVMDDKWDIEYDIHVENYFTNKAKYNIGDIVHTWINGKCF